VSPERLPEQAAEPESVRSFLAGALAAPLMDNRWFTRHIVLDRWFLHAGQSAMQAD